MEILKDNKYLISMVMVDFTGDDIDIISDEGQLII